MSLITPTGDTHDEKSGEGSNAGFSIQVVLCGKWRITNYQLSLRCILYLGVLPGSAAKR